MQTKTIATQNAQRLDLMFRHPCSRHRTNCPRLWLCRIEEIKLRVWCLAVLVGLASALMYPSLSLVRGQGGTSRPVIACFQQRRGGVSSVAHPRNCVFRGYRGREVVRVPVAGMKWGHWGANPTRAAFGTDLRNGRSVRVVAFRPRGCIDGRNWYSRAIIVFPGIGTWFELRLPTCLS
jgi:hypothetical protein